MCQRLAPVFPFRRGVVKWFNRAKGFGFITQADGVELFVHKAGLAPGQPLLRAGQLVQYTVAQRKRGLQAEEVAVLSSGGTSEESAEA
jgi:cold shock protein